MIKKSGIYIIENTLSGKAYIGSSNNVEKRWSEHRVGLRRGNHKNKHLQNAWNKYGEEAFIFEILCECEPEELIRIEKKALKIFKAEWGWNNLYNMCPVAGSRLGMKNSPESIAKMAAAKTGVPLAQETRDKIGAANRRRKWTSESKAKLSATITGRELTEEHKANLVKAWEKRKRRSA